MALSAVVLFTACQKDDDDIAPSVSISSPSVGAAYVGGQPILIAGNITDNESLHEFYILITKNDGADTLLNESISIHDETNHTFAETFTAPAVTDTTDVRLDVSAEDHDGNIGSRAFSFKIVPQ